MARGYTTRRLEVFSIHALLTNGKVNYSALFQDLANIPAARRVYEEGEKVVAILKLSVEGDFVRIVAVEGDKNLHPLIYNYEKATERIEQLQIGELVATRTHGLINLKTRVAIIEYNQRGAKASDIARALEHIGRVHTSWKNLKVTLVQKADVSFLEEIEKFERIRAASLRITRPNPSWDLYFEAVSNLADESDAHAVEISATADRGESLSRLNGVIKYIKQLARERFTYLQGAKISGTRVGEEAETSVSLNRHTAHHKAKVRLTEDGHVDDADIERKLAEFATSQQGSPEDLRHD